MITRPREFGRVADAVVDSRFPRDLITPPGADVNQPQMRVSMPDERVPGVYADFVSVWHTTDVFTFDFAALVRPPARVEGEGGVPVMQAQAQVVARVRIPPSQVFEIMKALERQLTAWEQETGRRPKPPPAPTGGDA